MSKLRIVIITYSWPPRNSISTHRPYSWARYWSEKGAKVTVLTAEKQSFDEPLDMPLQDLEGVEVIEVPYIDFFSWLPSTIIKFPYILSLAKKIKLWLIKNLGSSWDPRKAWPVAAQSIAARLAPDTDVVVSTFGPSGAHLIGCKMKQINPSLYWVADYRDLWSDNPNLAGAPKTLRNKIRKKELATVGLYADSLTAISDDMVLKLSELIKKPVKKITNGFDIDEELVRKRFQQSVKKPDGIFRIVYTGSIYQNTRDPIPLLQALVSLVEKGELSPNSITVDFYGARLDYIKELSLNPKYSPFIRIMGHVSREKTLEIQHNAGLLLLLENSKEESRGVITGKIFEYIAAGRPIICVGSRPDFEIGKILSMTGTGTVFENNENEKIKHSILQTFFGRGLYENYKPKFDKVIQFSRKQIANEYLNILKNMVSKENQLSSLSLSNQQSSNSKSLASVTHIITGLEKGGAERSLYNLLTNGLEGPFKNRVISLMSEGHYGVLLRKAGIPLTCLNMSQGVTNLINIKALWKFRAALRDNPPDILQGWMYHGNLVASLGAFLSPKPLKVGWNIRLSLEIFSDQRLRTRIGIKLAAILSIWAKLIIYNSSCSRSQHRAIGFTSKYDNFIPNGFITETWRPDDAKRQQIRRELSISENIRVIGYVGRGDDQKDLPNLFEAFEKISQKHSNTILITIGRNLEKYKPQSDHIKFLGERSDIQNFMLSFDPLCLSSCAEGFPNVIGEAMSCGLPCVTTDVGDASKVVGDTGWISVPRDSNSLADCLDAALSCAPKELKNRGNLARDRIVKHFSMASVKEKYISLYHFLNK